MLVKEVKNYIGIAKNNVSLLFLSLLFTLPLLLDFLSVAIGGKMVTYACYGIVGILSIPLIWRGINRQSILTAIAFYSVIGINYFLFPELRVYYSELSMLLVLAFYVPLAVLIVLNIKDWDYLIKIFFPFSIIAILLNMYITFFSGLQLYLNEDLGFNYMELSYSVLPAICFAYSYYRNEKKLIGLLIFLIGLISVFAFGARAVLFYIIGFVIVRELMYSGISVFYKLLIIMIVGIICLNTESILYYLSNISFLSDSRILAKFDQGDLFAHDSRTIIYDACKQRINTMGFDVSGLFGDRKYCSSVYPHNIFYEMLMQHGWILGIIALFIIFRLLLKSLFNSTHKEIALILIVSYFCKFFISGSYLIDGRFWVMLFAIISINRISKKRTVQ